MNLSLGNKFNADLNYNYTKLVFEDKENLNSIIAGLRLSYQFTPKIFIQSLIQRNNITNVTSMCKIWLVTNCKYRTVYSLQYC